MPTPKRNAPTITETPTGETDPRTVWPKNVSGAEHRKEHDDGQREHQHLRAQAGAAAVGDEDAPRRREAERGVIEDDASRRADQERGSTAAS